MTEKKYILLSEEAQIVTNKTIDADSNIISNIEVSDMKSDAVSTSIPSIGAVDTKLATEKAVKTIADTKIDTAGNGLSISGTTVGHSNAVTAMEDSKLGQITYDAQGHVTGFVEKSVIDNVTTTTTDQPLSANQGKLLNDRINNLESIGRFLSLWNCATGMPTTEPATTPYDYKTGDYYIITTVASGADPNYKPDGTQYTGTASTTTVSYTVQTGDIWRYDGSVWAFESNHSVASGVSDVQVNGTSITSAGVANITVDSTITASSTNPVQSSAIYNRIRYGTAAEREAASAVAGDVWIEISS